MKESDLQFENLRSRTTLAKKNKNIIYLYNVVYYIPFLLTLYFIYYEKRETGDV